MLQIMPAIMKCALRIVIEWFSIDCVKSAQRRLSVQLITSNIVYASRALLDAFIDIQFQCDSISKYFSSVMQPQ